LTFPKSFVQFSRNLLVPARKFTVTITYHNRTSSKLQVLFLPGIHFYSPSPAATKNNVSQFDMQNQYQFLKKPRNGFNQLAFQAVPPPQAPH